jgi:hypothetical protein
MEIKKIILVAVSGTVLLTAANSCIDNNNKDNNGSQGQNQDSNYENQAPTYNTTEDDMEEKLDTVSTDKRVPKDPVEVKSKDNAASK